MSSTPPTTLGKYQIIREIARSNDIVYEAYDPLMNRRVALKELAMPGGSSSQQREDRIKRFLREARAAGSLAHPNIMTVYEVGQEGDRYFIAMEYLDGKTLRNEIDTKGFLTQTRAVEIAKAILSGLEYAHGRGVIHRDIKPDNVQLLTNGNIKLTDFGIARLTFEPNLTMDGQVFGTPSYMSPEQVVGRDIDARSDLFSVGVVLYEMLAGVKPFQGDSVVTITYGIMNKTADRPQQINWPVWQVIEKALDKSPQLRYRTATEFIDALDQATVSTQTGSYSAPQPTQVLAPPPQQPVYPPTAYGAPQPPPQPYASNPYAQQAQIQQIQQIQQVQPVQNYPQMPVAQPYGYGQQPAPPPVHGPISVPPSYGAPMPVYYPPPPRKPLIRVSPQARKFLAQLFVYLVALAAVVGLFVIGLDSVSKIAERTAGDPANAKRNGGPAGKADAANNWNSQGMSAQNAGDLDKAEAAFIEAIRANPKLPVSHLNLGELYVTKAAREGDPDRRREFMRRACESFQTSGSLYKDPFDRDHANIRAAESYLNLAQLYVEAGQSSKAREQLYKARPLARSDPRLMIQIDNLNNQLSGYL